MERLTGKQIERMNEKAGNGFTFDTVHWTRTGEKVLKKNIPLGGSMALEAKILFRKDDRTKSKKTYIALHLEKFKIREKVKDGFIREKDGDSYFFDIAESAKRKDFRRLLKYSRETAGLDGDSLIRLYEDCEARFR